MPHQNATPHHLLSFQWQKELSISRALTEGSVGGDRYTLLSEGLWGNLSLSANSKKYGSNFCHTTLLELGKKYISNPRKDLGGGQKFARLEKGSTPPLTPKELETQPNSAENSPPKIHTETTGFLPT